MPGWGEILNEINQEAAKLAQANPAHVANAGFKAANAVRQQYLARLSAHTNRNTIIYASGWLQKPQAPGEFLSVHPSDMDGFLEVVKAADTAKDLDIILHSPGGSPEAAEQIVTYLRQKFGHIRVIVPLMAMSAATMIACGADKLVLARHSTLGPTDPQMPIRTNTNQFVYVPAHALKKDFDDAQDAAIANQGAAAVWSPIIGQYPPGILTQCNNALQLTKELVENWLQSYMFKGDADAKKKAASIADFFAQADHYTHGRPLMRDLLKSQNLVIDDLEDDNIFQDLVMSVYHATTHTLGGTNVVKLIESDKAKQYMKILGSP